MAEGSPGPQVLLASPLSKTTLLPGKAELQPDVRRPSGWNPGQKVMFQGKMSGFGACQLLLLCSDLGSRSPCARPHRWERGGCPEPAGPSALGPVSSTRGQQGQHRVPVGPSRSESRECVPRVSLHPDQALVPAYLLLARCLRSPYL